MSNKRPTDDPAPATVRVAGSARREAMRAAARRPAMSRHESNKIDNGVAAAEPPASPIKPLQSGSLFISYARSDVQTVHALVMRLRRLGYAVTWDHDFVAGCDFEKSIRSAIDAAEAVIVVWSAAAALSLFVRDEAKRALKLDKLIATHVDGFDLDDVPLGFGHIHAIPLGDEAALQKSLAGKGLTRLPAPAGKPQGRASAHAAVRTS